MEQRIAFKLTPHKSSSQNGYEISSKCTILDNRLMATFTVKKPEHERWNISDNFSKSGIDNWGLWEHDVVEIFIQQDKSDAPYLELQLSPAEQKFALQVEKPRKKYFKPDNFDFKGKSIIKDNVWTASIEVELPKKFKALRGGLFACLGPQTKRSYFATNPNSETQPDFHRPDLFIELN